MQRCSACAFWQLCVCCTAWLPCTGELFAVMPESLLTRLEALHSNMKARHCCIPGNRSCCVIFWQLKLSILTAESPHQGTPSVEAEIFNFRQLKQQGLAARFANQSGHAAAGLSPCGALPAGAAETPSPTATSAITLTPPLCWRGAVPWPPPPEPTGTNATTRLHALQTTRSCSSSRTHWRCRGLPPWWALSMWLGTSCSAISPVRKQAGA